MCAGTNTLNLIQLCDMSEYVFIVFMGPPPSAMLERVRAQIMEESDWARFTQKAKGFLTPIQKPIRIKRDADEL